MSGHDFVKTILVMSANPKGTTTLRLGEEVREIKQGLERAKQRNNFKIESEQALRDIDIHRYILDYRPQIVHFSGHGSGEEGLVFEDNNGYQKLVDAEALADLFEIFASEIECVVLNACYSQIQAKAIAKHINYVIGMNKQIGDAAAIKFAIGFYDALGAGRDVEFAYKLGCRVIRMAGISEHLTPELLKKQNFCQENIPKNTQPIPLLASPPQDARNIGVVSSPPSPNNSLTSTQKPTNIAQYRQKVEEFAGDGVHSWEESYILSDLQKQLGLTDEQASTITKEVLEPYQLYQQQFNKRVVATGYPLTEQAQAELDKFQKYYKIKDEYVSLLKQEVEKQQPQTQQSQQSSSQLIQTQPFDFQTATLTRKNSKSSRILGFFSETTTPIIYEIQRDRKQAELFQENLCNGVFLEMVKIPDGNFLMGSPEGELEGCDNEKPQQKVNMKTLKLKLLGLSAMGKARSPTIAVSGTQTYSANAPNPDSDKSPNTKSPGRN